MPKSGKSKIGVIKYRIRASAPKTLKMAKTVRNMKGRLPHLTK